MKILKFTFSNKPLKYITIGAVIIFYLLTFGQIFFSNKTFLTISGDEILEGVAEKKSHISKEITTIDPGGFAWIDYPLSQVNSRKIHNFKIPLWNNYSGGGQPLFANQTSQAFSIIRYLFPLNFFPNALMWDFFIIFRLIIFFILFLLFLLTINVPFYIAFLISLVSSVNGYFLLYINLFHLDVEIFLPLIFLAIEYFKKGEKLWLLPFSILFIVVGGNIQSTIIAIITSFLYFFTILFVERQHIKYIFRIIIFFLLGLALSAYYLLPFLEYYSNSFHVHSNLTGGQYFKLETIIGFLGPFISGPIHGQWFKNINQHLIPPYIGLTTIIIFLSFLTIKVQNNFIKSRLFAFYFIMSLFLIKLFTPFLNKLVIDIPILNRIIYTKYFFPFYFSFYSILAILLSNIKDNYFKSLRFKLKIYILFIVILLIELLALYIQIKSETTPSLKYIKLRYLIYNNILQNANFLLFILTFSLISSMNKNSKKLFITLIIIFIFFENFINVNLILDKKSSRYNSFKYPSKYIQFFKNKKKEIPFRIYATNRILISQLSAGHGIEDLRTLDALVVKNHINFMRGFITGYNTEDYLFYSGGKTLKNIKTIKFLEMANVKYLLTDNDSEDKYIQSFLDKNYKKKYFNSIKIYELNPLPRVYIPKKVFIAVDENEMYKIMQNEKFDPKSQAVVLFNNKKKKEVIECKNVKNASIKFNYQEDQIFINLNNLQCEAFLIITNTFFPGWKVLVNNKISNYYLANGSFMAIPINNKSKTIVVKYLPSSFMIGLIISFVSLLLIIFLSIKKGQKIKK